MLLQNVKSFSKIFIVLKNQALTQCYAVWALFFFVLRLTFV
nr:MAG TPA: hypothetical protein [Caudoviricetes sp.]